MPYELFLALRYLRSRRKRRLARLTALVAVIGISIGVAALIVALALANGFRDEMREKILRGTAHVNVMRADGHPIPAYREIAARVAKITGVTEATGTSYDGAVVIGPKGAAFAVLRGVDKGSEPTLAVIKGSIIDGSVTKIFEGQTKEEEPPGVLIGAELASRTGVRVGDVTTISTASANPNLASSTRQVFRVAGIFRAGLFEYDSTWIYVSLDVAPGARSDDRAASVISVQLADIYDAKRAAADIRAALGSSYTTVDWQEANRPLFTALALERRMGLFIVALMIVIAALNITTMLILVVVERRSDIGILTAIGATSRSIMAIFMIEGAMIGALGAFLGMMLGTVTCLVGNRYKLVSLPPDVYSISNVPFNAQIRDLLLAAFVAFLLSFLATIYPARAAARVRPVDMLRDAN